MSARVLDPEQSRVPRVATYLTAVEGPLTRSTLTALESLPIEAQFPVQPTKLGTPVFQTVPSVGLLIWSMSAETTVPSSKAAVAANVMNDFIFGIEGRRKRERQRGRRGDGCRLDVRVTGDAECSEGRERVCTDEWVFWGDWE